MAINRKLSESKFKSLIRKFQDTKILVVGDLMLDEYLNGTVSRISPEAPIPIVHLHSEEYKPGGASNVAHNIVSLGGRACMAGVIGKDSAGEKLLADLKSRRIEVEGVVTDNRRPTIVKTRVIAQHQQMLRIDREKPGEMADWVQGHLMDFIRRTIGEYRAIIFSDYGKGILSPSLCQGILRLARQHGILVTADPKPANILCFRGVDLVSPNQMEAEQAAGLKITDQKSLMAVGKKLLGKLKCRTVLITRGEAGMVLFDAKGRTREFPTMAREVFDVTGAGDTVIATLTLAWAAGATLEEAIFLANHAAGIVVGEIGAATVNPRQFEEVLYHAAPAGAA